MGLLDLLRIAAETFERLNVPYFVTGSVAAMAYGEPRLTNDIDIVVEIGERHVKNLLAAFPAADFCISEDAIREAIRNNGQFNIIHPESGIKVDVIVREDTPFDDSRFARLRRFAPAETYRANFAAPEDIIIKKMEYYKQGGSEKHLRDITGIMKISATIIDTAYILAWSKRLGLMEIWSAIQKRLSEA